LRLMSGAHCKAARVHMGPCVRQPSQTCDTIIHLSNTGSAYSRLLLLQHAASRVLTTSCIAMCGKKPPQPSTPRMPTAIPVISAANVRLRVVAVEPGRP
jgi:hypothetical protein